MRPGRCIFQSKPASSHQLLADITFNVQFQGLGRCLGPYPRPLTTIFALHPFQQSQPHPAMATPMYQATSGNPWHSRRPRHPHLLSSKPMREMSFLQRHPMVPDSFRHTVVGVVALLPNLMAVSGFSKAQSKLGCIAVPASILTSHCMEILIIPHTHFWRAVVRQGDP